MFAVALALGASLAFGVADYLAGAAARRLALLTVLVLSQCAGLVAIVVLVAARGEGPPDPGSFGWAALGALLGAGAVAALYRGLAVGLMSVVAPLAATAAAVPVVAGLMIGEAPTALQNAGIAVALIGVVLVSRSASGGGGRFAAGAGLGLLAALLIGCFLVTFDAASEGDPYWATLIVRSGTVSIFVLVALLRRPQLRVTRADAVGLAVIGLLDVAATMLFAVATTEGLVGVVSVLSSLYPVVTVALARAFLDERFSRAQAVGVVAAFAGIALIAAG
jgi:drug/metabolite transporter (DMT)-like permease